MMERVSPAGVAIGRQASLQSLQAQLARATAEVASGRKSDPVLDMGIGASLLYRLRSDIQQGGAIKNGTSLAGERMKTMQTAMTSIRDIFQDVSAQILAADVLKQQSYTMLSADTPDLLASIADLLNTDFQGQKVFGGTDGATRPLDGIAELPARIQSMLEAAVATKGGALDADDIAGLMQDIEDAFDDGGSEFYGRYYGSSSRTGDGAPNLVRIGDGQALAYDVRADHGAFRDALKALAMTSLLGNGASRLSEDARTALCDRAGELMRGAQTQLTTLAGTLGTKQARLERVAEIHDHGVQATTAQINDLERADYYSLSDQINTMQIQLQATYSITAQLSKLSLVNYL
ncbi:flagellin [Roseomonas marmotae]|uniref:Flagellin n=1 Tax=Roseomonas marmotae TaxID=2768161 RepID=A0ABS3KF52_9PROT|nr:flagellin [Roseomonas marmotae]MBO1076047.1 flagellar hook protein [Roseomonas marmotae]QTI81286.1 flagellar hook protein [Roseomonas marmotae]